MRTAKNFGFAVAASLLSPGLVSATDYATNPIPACRTMRNVAPGAPYLPEPNRTDARAAMALAGGPKSPLDHAPEIRRRYAQAFQLMQRIDADDTAALSSLQPDTPRIDLLIDRHIINLVWARSMLGVFYEEGRAPPVDYDQAAAFYRKAIDTRFVDDRGCSHTAPPATSVLTHLAGYYAYGTGVPRDPAKARELLQRAGNADARRILTLLDHDALPRDLPAYLDTIDTPARLADRAEAVEHPAPNTGVPSLMTWITNPDAAMATMTAPIWAAVNGVALILALLIAAIAVLWLLHWRRARLEQKSSFYRSAFAVYDAVQNIAGRIGLVAGGLIGCGGGIFMILQASLFGFVGPIRFLVLVSGITAIFGGIARLIEAARVSQSPAGTQVHGAARPAEESETQAAARGTPKTSPLRDRTFKD